MMIKHFYDSRTFTLTYLVYDPKSKDAILIDPVLDIDTSSGKIYDESLIPILNYLDEQKLNLHAVLETHAHADHLSSSHLIKSILPKTKIVIGEKIKLVQSVFKDHFNLTNLAADGSQFDLLLKDFEVVHFGSIQVKAIPTPGHTPACMSFLIEDALFTGDALFMPDYGTGRCDFPKGSSTDLFESITKNIYTLPDSTRIFVGHDYQPNGRDLKFETSVLESKNQNIQLKSSTSKETFTQFRTNRDKTLAAPNLLLPSIQVNINAGELPKAEDNGKMYLKLPINLKLDSLKRT